MCWLRSTLLILLFVSSHPLMAEPPVVFPKVPAFSEQPPHVPPLTQDEWKAVLKDLQILTPGMFTLEALQSYYGEGYLIGQEQIGQDPARDLYLMFQLSDARAFLYSNRIEYTEQNTERLFRFYEWLLNALWAFYPENITEEKMMAQSIILKQIREGRHVHPIGGGPLETLYASATHYGLIPESVIRLPFCPESVECFNLTLRTYNENTQDRGFFIGYLVTATQDGIIDALVTGARYWLGSEIENEYTSADLSVGMVTTYFNNNYEAWPATTPAGKIFFPVALSTDRYKHRSSAIPEHVGRDYYVNDDGRIILTKQYCYSGYDLEHLQAGREILVESCRDELITRLLLRQTFLLPDPARTWQLTILNTSSTPEPSQVTLRFRHDNTIRGQGPCNHYAGRYQLSAKRLSLSLDNLTSTKEACTPDQAQQEQYGFQLLQQIDRFEFDETGQLILIADNLPRIKGTSLITGKQRPVFSLGETLWEINTLYGQPLIPQSRITLRLTSVRIGGVNPCGEYTGHYQFSQNAIFQNLHKIAVTERDCAPELQQQEHQWLQLLQQVDRLEFDDSDQLLLIGQDQVLAVGQRRQ